MYLDPGFGGMLVQVIVAIVAAGGILLFSLRRKLRAFFSKNKGTDADKAPVDADTSAVEGVDDVVDMLSDDTVSDEKSADDAADEKADND